MTLCTASDDRELEQILSLQQRNHPSALSEQEAARDGFVTVRHSLPLLQNMNEAAPQVLAKEGDVLAGYALVMLESFQDMIPVLKPMFRKLSQIQWNGRRLDALRYYIMGQICVAEEFRGKGIFDALYAKHRELYGAQYDLCITSVSIRNQRSMRAHERVGFKIIHTFQDETDTWNILAWDWK